MARTVGMTFMGVSEMIDYTFKLMRNSGGAVFRVCLPGGLISGILGCVCLQWYLSCVVGQWGQLFLPLDTVGLQLLTIILGGYLRGIAGLLSVIVMVVTLLITAPAAYIQAARAVTGQNMLSVLDVYKLALPFWWRYLVSGLLLGIVISLGMILLVAPGIIASTWYALALPILFLEKVSPIAAIKRSKKMVEPYFWQVIGFGIYIMCIGIVMYFGINILVRTVIYVPPIAGVLKISWYFMVQQLTMGVITATMGVITALGMALGSLGLVTLYFQLRTRTEGFDLADDIQRITANVES